MRFLTLFFAASCASGATVMTMNTFYDIPIGSSSWEVEEQVGKPYAVHRIDDCTEEYEYIERIRISAVEQEERHYFLIIKEGKVISKRVEGSSTPRRFYDSYDMQTTESNPSQKEAEEEVTP
ncbi:MAG: hypothetical protein KGI80_02960 [Verrucomicrobiota bacterium]|nr:hypothetical protein [Verrucomicrobiota bacterium]